MLFYPLLLLASLIGAVFMFTRRFLSIRELSEEELKGQLVISRSVRTELKEKFVDPARDKFFEIYLPAFWRAIVKLITQLRLSLMKIEASLKHLSDNLRGRHIKMNTEEKTEYWQNLNGAKQNSTTKKADL